MYFINNLSKMLENSVHITDANTARSYTAKPANRSHLAVYRT